MSTVIQYTVRVNEIGCGSEFKFILATQTLLRSKNQQQQQKWAILFLRNIHCTVDTLSYYNIHILFFYFHRQLNCRSPCTERISQYSRKYLASAKASYLKYWHIMFMYNCTVLVFSTRQFLRQPDTVFKACRSSLKYCAFDASRCRLAQR